MPPKRPFNPSISPSACRQTPGVFCVRRGFVGAGQLDQNPVLPETNAMAGLELVGQTYQLHGKPVWRVTCSEKVLTLRSDYAAGADAPPFTLAFNQKANHATLLGLMKPGEQQMSLPCLLHLPDMGTLRITCNGVTPGSTTTRGGS